MSSRAPFRVSVSVRPTAHAMPTQVDPVRPTLAAKPLAITLIGLLTASTLLVSPGASHDAPDGHFDILGEDGAVWVPADHAGTAYLPAADLGAYHNHTETEAVLMSLAAARPDVFSLHDVGTSVEGRTIWMLRATGPGDDALRPRVLLDGAHHGDEVIGSESLVRFLLRLHDTYDSNATVRTILDEVVLDVVPMVNVDGIQAVPECTHYATCRKNANGVDLNRNYPDHWGGSGSSGSPSSATYRGPSALSEPESRAVAALLDSGDYALHASFHSGAELILWPHGWTTAAPAEATVYETLGDELTELTGIPHGQTSQILYTASGTTMDQAYGSAAGWRPISFSPEAYRGSGNAFDWWLLFNPPETEASVAAHVEKWIDFSFHLAAEAPRFRAAVIDAPYSLAVGPDAGTLDVSVHGATRRPLLDAALHLDPYGAPIHILSANPAPLDDVGGTQTRTFALLAERTGDHDVSIVLDAGPAGTRTVPLMLHLTQIGFDLDLHRTVMGSPHHNAAHVTVSTGPFDRIAGTVSVTLEPAGIMLGNASFDTMDTETVDVAFTGRDLPAGTHRVVARTQFTASLDAVEQPGLSRTDATLVVQRPQVVSDKRFPVASPAGEPFDVVSVYHNTGNLPAIDVTIKEHVPAGYVWLPDDPVPVPVDPTGLVPDRITRNADGTTGLTWDLGDLAPGGARVLRYRLLPTLPGEAVLGSSWAYMGDFGDVYDRYDGRVGPKHTTT